MYVHPHLCVTHNASECVGVHVDVWWTGSLCRLSGALWALRVLHGRDGSDGAGALDRIAAFVLDLLAAFAVLSALPLLSLSHTARRLPPSRTLEGTGGCFALNGLAEVETSRQRRPISSSRHLASPFRPQQGGARHAPVLEVSGPDLWLVVPDVAHQHGHARPHMLCTGRAGCHVL